MINFLLASDDLDGQLGYYFSRCRTLLAEQLLAPFNAVLLTDGNCNSVYLDLCIERLSGAAFLFAAYTHGDENCLRVSSGSLVAGGVGNAKFRNCFVYSVACHAGKVLGPDLIANGCACFIGYSREVSKLIDPMGIVESIKCDNYGIYNFIHQDVTAYRAYEMMKAHFVYVFEQFTQRGNPIAASMILDAGEALVFHGNPNVRKNDFN